MNKILTFIHSRKNTFLWVLHLLPFAIFFTLLISLVCYSKGRITTASPINLDPSFYIKKIPIEKICQCETVFKWHDANEEYPWTISFQEALNASVICSLYGFNLDFLYGLVSIMSYLFPSLSYKCMACHFKHLWMAKLQHARVKRCSTYC